MQVFADLVRVVHAISQDGARELDREGLTPAQYQLLVTVDRHPACTQQHLGEVLGVTKGNVSALVSKLEGVGLIMRRPEGAAYSLDLTAAGRVRLAELRPRHAAFMAARFSALDDDQLEQLAALVAALDENA